MVDGIKNIYPHTSGYITITDKDIEDLLKDIEMPFIGEVSPGCYQIGKGMYTGRLGWEQFNKQLDKKIKQIDFNSSIKALLQTKEKVSKKERNI